MKKMIGIVMLVGLMLISTGCAYVPATDKAVIHNDMLNAVAMNAKVQTDTSPMPDYVKPSFAAYAKMLVAIDAWANGQKFPTTTTSTVTPKTAK
jgi:hypothetical protein